MIKTILKDLLIKCHVEYDIQPVPDYDAYTVNFYQGDKKLMDVEIAGFSYEVNWKSLLNKLKKREIGE